MTKKVLGVLTSVVAALALVGIAWAGTDAGTSTSAALAGETEADASLDDSSSSTDATVASSTDAAVASSTDAAVASSTGATAESSTTANADASAEANAEGSASTSTSMEATTSTSADASSTTSTTTGSTTSTTTGSTTSTTVDDDDDSQAPEGVTTHIIPGVGTVTVEVESGQLILVSVSAPGWNVERDHIEPDRIELEFTSVLTAEAEFEARLNNGRVEVDVEVRLG